MSGKYFTVGFVYNEPCPLTCNFCCHTKENVGPGRLGPDNVLPIIEKYAMHPSVRRFAFTGGDPFIYVRDITDIMRRSREAGVTQPFHIVTSGYWAKTDEIVEIYLSALQAVGMDMLYVSYDFEHRKTVPPEYIYRIDRFCAKNGLILSVYGVFWRPGPKVRDLLPDLITKHTNETIASSIGRARDHPELIYKELPDDAKHSCGRPFKYDITIYPNGETYPCCSGGFNKEASLTLGNSFSDDVDSIIRNCLTNFTVTTAKEIGFDKLFKKMDQLNIPRSGLPDFKDVNSVCEICVAVHGTEEARKLVKPALDALEVDYCVSLYSGLIQAVDTDRSNKREEV